MKILNKITLLITVLFFACNAFADEKPIFSYGPDGKNYYKLATDKILVKFRKDLNFEQKQKVLSAFRAITPLKQDNVLPAPDVTMAEVQNLSEEGIQNLLKQLQANPDVEFANPFLIYADGTYQGIQDRVIIRLFSSADYGKMDAKAKELNVQVIERDDYDPNVYILGTTKNSAGNALEIANKLYESKLFDYAEPDFLLLLKKFNTNDTYLGYQWSLNNTGSSIQYNGTAGADMKVFNAWGITAGSSTIKVAIIDEGVDLTHDDLTPNLLAGYDATGLGSAGGPSGNDAHGTACAGIVAGVGNNNLGVAGVAYNCKIIPVRIAYSNAQGNWVTSNTWIGNAINWAWQTGGAHVLSNSWGGGSSSSAINNAITAAVTSGRGGLGSPVLFAAGNDNGPNSYPATLTNVISVVAMSMCYERKNPASCDGENWWGSNYGTGVDVTAPGVKIYSTDISGSAGYSAGDYVPNFNGTSSATPNAAGVMALILSANSTLTATQARNALETNCRKVGSYTYNSGVSGQPNGTWSNDLGYGLVDAYQAVLSVAPQVQNDAGISAISSPAGSFCGTTINPSLILNNYGSNTLTSVAINYRVDAGSYSVYNWSGSLASAASTTINLSAINVSTGSHSFNAYTSNPNGNSDSNTANDAKSSSFIAATNALTLTIVFDNYPEETSWEVRDGSSNVVASGGTYGTQADGSTKVENFCVTDGCFNFIIYDAYGDGMCCSFGNGSYVLRNAGGTTLASGGTFGASQTTNFCVSGTMPLSASISSSTNVSCNGGSSGSATVSASGGTTPYSYLWSNGATTATASGLAAGSYSVTVTDASSSQATANVTITQPSVLSASSSSSNVTCNGANNGSASVSASGGTTPYSYLWSNGATSASLTGLAAGNYSVTVTDNKGCTANAAVSISQPTAILLSSTTTPASCANATNGSVDLSASGGAGSYTYSWSNGASTQDLSAVAAGSYSVTVTDASGCSANTSAVVGTLSTLGASASSTAVSCNGGSNGSVSASASGGTAPYTYLWNTGATTANISGVTAGNYSVTVSDAAGCSVSANTSVSQPSALNVSMSSGSETCTTNDGSATASVSGGTAPYNYSWNNGGNTTTINGLAAGNYSVTVTDANGCSSGNNVNVVYDCSPCNYETVNSNNFESSLGIWTDGGTDCSRLSNATYASSGTYTVQLRDNSSTSLASTGNLNLTVYEEVTVSFSFITTGFSSGEDFWLQLSTNGGTTYTTVKGWVMNTDFTNNVRQNVQVVLNGPFTSTSRLRLRCDASDDVDAVYIDDVVISGCRPPLNCTYQSVNNNNFESSLGIWTDGGTDCSRLSNATYASSGTYSVQLRDNTTTSLMSTGNLNLSAYQELTVSFSFITTGFSSGEDFWLQLSGDGGVSYSTVKSWVMNTDFTNNVRQNVQVVLSAPFASSSRLRLRCDASDDVDAVYIDDVNITGCYPSGSGKTDEPVITEEGNTIVQSDLRDDVNIYPNPTTEELNVLYTATADKQMNVMITDMVGKVVLSETINIDEGQNRLNYNLSNLSNGVYSVTFINATERINKRLIINR